MNVANPSFRRRRQSLVSSTKPTTTTTISNTINRSSSSSSSSNNDNDNRGHLRSLSTTSSASRRRTKQNSLDFTISSCSSSSPSPPPLQGIVACLSGQSEDVKDRIHRIIQKWGGGSIMGHFDPNYVTHLILDAPVGSKYLNWRRHLEWYRKQKQQRQQQQQQQPSSQPNRQQPQPQQPQNIEKDDESIQSSAWAEKLIVVTTSWVEACHRENRRVSEEGFQLMKMLDVGEIKSEAGNDGTSTRLNHLLQQSLPAEIIKMAPTLEERCEYMLQNVPVANYCSLFLGQSFLLVGFDFDDEPDDGLNDENDDDDDPSDNDDGSETHNYGGPDDTSMNKTMSSNNGDGDGESSSDCAINNTGDTATCLPRKRRIRDGGGNHRAVPSQNYHRTGRGRRDRHLRFMKEKFQTLKISLSKLIRRAGGTIFWEPNEWITTVVLNDNYSKRVWDDVRYFCREHPMGPICVTMDWILTSIFFHRERTNVGLVIPPPPFPPEPRIQQTMKSKRNRVVERGGAVVGESSNSTSSENSTSKITAGKIPESKSYTSSSIFRGDVFVISLSKSTNGTLTFRYEDMESTITRNGGLLLTKSLLLAIKNDAKKSAASNTSRGYYVVSNSWVHTDGASSLPLLAELSKLCIKVVPVSLIWISACVKNDRKYDPIEYPLLFQPQTWPIRRLSKSSSSHTGERNDRFLIAVTGFVDSSRYGIMSMLDEIGAQYTDNLTRNNTHLICKEGRGLKYTKALEWGLHIVSIEWLYHIIRHGFHDGCERKFLTVAS